MAEGLGGRKDLPRRDRPFQTQVLRPGGVPLPLRCRAARGASPQLHRAGRGGPPPPSVRVQRAVPHGLGRLRPAHRELRDEEPHPPGHRDEEERGPLPRAAQILGLLLRLGPRGEHHRPRVLQVDAVDLFAAVQARPGLQERDERQLVHRLQVRAGQRGSGQRRVRALRQRGGAPRQEPVDAEDHRLRRQADRRAGRSGLHRPRRHPAEELDRPQLRRRDRLRHHHRRQADRLHHPLRHAVRRDLHGALAGKYAAGPLDGRGPDQERGRGQGLPGRGRPQERL